MSDRLRFAAKRLWPGAALLMAAAIGRTADAPEPCCFTNDQYAGVCQVVPEPGETCSDVLGYLNNPTSAGKTYCGSTTIRGGWSQVNCSAGTPAPTTEPANAGAAAVADRR